MEHISKLLTRTKAFFILLVCGSLWRKTSIVMQYEDFVGWIKVTKCCKIGPVTNEKYCPE